LERVRPWAEWRLFAPDQLAALQEPAVDQLQLAQVQRGPVEQRLPEVAPQARAAQASAALRLGLAEQPPFGPAWPKAHQ
jgi:hypothetical protein